MTNLSDYGGASRDEVYLQYTKKQEEMIAERDRAELESIAQQNVEYNRLIERSRHCKRFIESPVGRYLRELALKDAEAARTELADLDTETLSDQKLRARVIHLQFEANIPVFVFKWIDEAIQNALDEGIILEEDAHE